MPDPPAAEKREPPVPLADAATLPPSTLTSPRDPSSEAAPFESRLMLPCEFGDYVLMEEIARGGMGVVYKARQKGLNRIVAVKMILAGRLASQAEVDRFRVEAEAAANLRDPNIVAIHEVGEHQGQHFFSMDYVDGPSLGALVRDEPLSCERAAGYVLQIAMALQHAHDQGILHRDLKPSNVLVDSHDKVHITDFGLAKRSGMEQGLTVTGQVLGTPSYMPPEQAACRRGEVGPPSDVYSMGAILYELITGKPPFRAGTAFDTLLLVLDAEPDPPRSINEAVPRDLEMICLKCLEKDPLARYQTARALADDLGRFLAGDPVQGSSFNLLSRMGRALAHSQHEDKLRGWGLGLIGFGIVIFLTHVVIWALESAGAGGLAAHWAPRLVMIASLLAIFWISRPHSLMPTNSVERLLWSIWFAYFLSIPIVSAILWAQGRPHADIYIWACLMSGMSLFMMGSQVWGFCYAIGLAFMLAAPLLAWHPPSAPLAFGTLWGIALGIIGGRYWRMGLVQSTAATGC